MSLPWLKANQFLRNVHSGYRSTFYVVNIRALGLRNNEPRNLTLPDVWGKIDCDSNKNLPIQRKCKLPPCWVTCFIPGPITWPWPEKSLWDQPDPSGKGDNLTGTQNHFPKRAETRIFWIDRGPFQHRRSLSFPPHPCPASTYYLLPTAQAWYPGCTDSPTSHENLSISSLENRRPVTVLLFTLHFTFQRGLKITS